MVTTSVACSGHLSRSAAKLQSKITKSIKTIRQQNGSSKEAHYCYSIVITVIPGQACLGSVGTASSLCTCLCASVENSLYLRLLLFLPPVPKLTQKTHTDSHTS